MENRKPLLILFALAAAALLWRVETLQNLPISLYVDEAQYWTWSRELQWGYFSKPPLVAFLIFCSTKIFGDGILGVKFLAMLCYPAAAFCLYFAARRLDFSVQESFFAALLALFLPIFAWLGLVVSTDAPLCFLWSAAFYFFVRAQDENRAWDWLI